MAALERTARVVTRTLLTGATGTLGKKLRARLLAADHDVVAASRSPPSGGSHGADDPATGNSGDSDGSIEWVELDLAEGTGIESAVEDVDVIVHAASDASGDHEAVDARGTRRLAEAAAAAGVSNLVYVSIVGIDAIPYSYYEHKLAAEAALRESAVPETIVRATQFHEFVDEVLETIAWLPIWPFLTDFEIQPIAAGEVADAVVEYAIEDPSGYVPEVGGPEVRTGRELAEAYRSARGLRRPIVRFPLPGTVASRFRAGAATAPERAVGTRTWEEWLIERYD